MTTVTLAIACVLSVACRSNRSVQDVVDAHLPAVLAKYKPICDAQDVPWPPKRIQVIVFKRERVVELWAASRRGSFARLGDFSILAASGGPGPKRREGDRQVPEGFYTLSSLNPNSKYHLSIFVDYPNRDDVRNSELKRAEMGGEIFIHGKAVSIGCVAIGDRGIEELFTICALVSAPDRKAMICPVDFRREPTFSIPDEQAWVKDLYGRLRAELGKFLR